MSINQSHKIWILTILSLLFFHTVTVNAESTSFRLQSDNYDHLNQLFEPSDVQPSPLPVHVWVDVTNLSICQMLDSTEMVCDLDESIALGSEQVRITYPTKQIEDIKLNNNDIQLDALQATSKRSRQNSELTYQLQESAQTLSIDLTTIDPIAQNTIPDITISLRRDTVSSECLLNGVTNDGSMGLNLGERDFRTQQNNMEFWAGIEGLNDSVVIVVDEILPINELNVVSEIEKLSDLGVDWVRFPIKPMRFGGFFDVDEREPKLGNVDWDRTTEQYNIQIDNLCDRAGISSLPVLTEKLVWEPELAINSGTPTRPATEGDVDVYANFRNAYLTNVKKIAEDLTNVRRWQIWNEPDLRGNYFSLIDIDDNDIEKQERLRQFTTLVRLTKEAIEENHPRPDREFVLGGISNVWLDDGADWLQQLYAQNISVEDHINYLGVHPYSYSDVSNDGDESNDTIRSIDPDNYLRQTDEGETGHSPLEFISDIVGEIPLAVTEIGWDASEETTENGIFYDVNQDFYNNPVADNPLNTGAIVSKQLQGEFLEASYSILLDSDITHYPNRPGESNIDNTIFWYRYDDIKETVPENDIQDARNPQESLADASPIGFGNPISTILSRNRQEIKENDELKIPINHWWGLIDEDGNNKPAYCSYVTVAISQGSLSRNRSRICTDPQSPLATTVSAMHSQTDSIVYIAVATFWALLVTTTLWRKTQ